MITDWERRSFAWWRFRAYLDLGPVPAKSPHHLYGIDFAFRALVDSETYPRIQSALNPSFRAALIHTIHDTGYDVYEPGDLAPALRTERWETLCQLCDSFQELPTSSQVKLAWLLSKLCFQAYLLQLLPASVMDHAGRSAADASLAYNRAYSRYRRFVDNVSSSYSIDEFAHIAQVAPPGIARVDAHYQMVVQNVKDLNNLQAVEHWQTRHLAAIEQSKAELDEFNYILVMSRYHRVGGFIPQMHRDREGTIAEMALAEQYARALPRPNEVYAIAADEMLYPVLESRTKEAMWIGDLDLALERAREATDLSPYDARAWLHLGQIYVDRDDPEQARHAYRKAARYAPPGREIACFMAGQCSEALDDLESACDDYLAALEADPQGVSAAMKLQELASRTNHRLLLDWAEQRAAVLADREQMAPLRRPEVYKHLPPPAESIRHGQ